MSAERVSPETHHPMDVQIVPSTETDILQIIEARNKLMGRLVAVAVQATHPAQWENLGGKPWPTGPACEAMARVCAVSISQTTREKLTSRDDEGEYYIWVYRAKFSLPGGVDSIEAEGTCSSRDSFLGTETSDGRDLSEIDEGSLMKAALTNCHVNGITKLLGVRNMSWERLAELGISRDGVHAVKYKTGNKGGGQGGAKYDGPVFGQNKGKLYSELSDRDLGYFHSRYMADLNDPEKSKFHENTQKHLDSVNAEITRRAEKGSGVKTPAGKDPGQIWAKIRALPELETYTDAQLKVLIKHATGKANPQDLVEDDIWKVTAKAKEERESGGAS